MIKDELVKHSSHKIENIKSGEWFAYWCLTCQPNEGFASKEDIEIS